jgi:hypothetical protein
VEPSEPVYPLTKVRLRRGSVRDERRRRG